MDIKAVLNRSQQGDRTAFAMLIRHYQQALFGYLGRMGLNQAAAEDIAQETFLRAWQGLNRYDPKRAEFSTWLFTIARNLALNELDRAAAKKEVSSDDDLSESAAGEPSPDQAIFSAQQRERLRKALLRLPLEDRSALALAYFQALDLASIARIEACSVGTIKVRLHRAKQKLRQLLEQDDE